MSEEHSEEYYEKNRQRQSRHGYSLNSDINAMTCGPMESYPSYLSEKEKSDKKWSKHCRKERVIKRLREKLQREVLKRHGKRY